MTHRAFFCYPAALGLAGAGALVLVGGPTAVSATLAILLVVAAAGAGSRLLVLESRLARESAQYAAVPSVESEFTALRGLCLRAFPVWARQLETSRDAGDTSVAAISRLFAGTVQRLSNAVSASKGAMRELSGDSGGVFTAIDRSDASLREVATTLANLEAAKGAVLAEVKRYAADLADLAQTVQHIAMQVRFLSFNAAIEAARAGEAGQSFAVVAREMRELATLSAEAGANMARKVELIDRIDQTLADVFGATARGDGTGTGAAAQADVAIREVMQRFRQLAEVLSKAVEVMESESEGVGREISEALVQLQFQDRVSQIIAHVASGCTSLARSLEDDAAEPLDADRWMEGMALEFSTHEEFDNLHGRREQRALESTTFF